MSEFKVIPVDMDKLEALIKADALKAKEDSQVNNMITDAVLILIGVVILVTAVKTVRKLWRWLDK